MYKDRHFSVSCRALLFAALSAASKKNKTLCVLCGSALNKL